MAMLGMAGLGMAGAAGSNMISGGRAHIDIDGQAVPLHSSMFDFDDVEDFGIEAHTSEDQCPTIP